MPITYNFELVILSALIASIASFIALELSGQVVMSQGVSRQFWLMGGAIAMGTGIWSMHFIAMLAFSIPVLITYNTLMVMVSLIAAILACYQALFIVSHPTASVFNLLGGGTLMGIGIAVMHYSGMAAMQMPANLSYKPSLFVLSVVVAIAVAIVALKLSIRFRDPSRRHLWLSKLLTACVMGSAVLTMHYTAMAAAVFEPNSAPLPEIPNLDNGSLAYLIGVFTAIILGLALLTLYAEPETKNL